MNQLVYIIIINYNGIEDTLECLKSLLKVNYNNFKIIVVDNASKNNEAGIIDKACFNNVEVISSEKNLGFAGGNNLGIKKALSDGADFIILLNNDTIVDEGFVKFLLKPFENKNTGITTSKIFYYSEPKKIWYAGANFNHFTGESRHIGLNKIDSELFSKEKMIERASGCCMMVKNVVFEKIGLFDEKYFLLFEESDFCYRAVQAGFKIYFSPMSKVWHKVSQTTGASSPNYIYYYKRNNLFFISKHFNFVHRFIYYFFSIFQSLAFIIYWSIFHKDDVGKKIKSLLSAYFDFSRKKMGKKKYE